MGQRAKIHHFVPKVLQRQFVHEGERIWYSRRVDGAWGAPELRNISSTFQEKDLYTVLMDNVYSDLVERQYYGRIDDYLGDIIPSILYAFKQGKAPLFRGEHLDDIRQCTLAMIRRTPDFSPEIYGGDEERGRMFVQQAIDHYLEYGGQPHRVAELEAELRNPARLRAQGRDMRVRASLAALERSEAAISECDVRWGVCEDRASFILPSIISYRAGNGGSTSLTDPKVEIWMPISPKIAMVLVRNPEGRIPAVNRVLQAKVRIMNMHAMTSSTSIASHSQALLESLTGRRVKAAGRRKAGFGG